MRQEPYHRSEHWGQRGWKKAVLLSALHPSALPPSPHSASSLIFQPFFAWSEYNHVLVLVSQWWYIPMEKRVIIPFASLWSLISFHRNALTLWTSERRDLLGRWPICMQRDTESQSVHTCGVCKCHQIKSKSSSDSDLTMYMMIMLHGT